MMRTNGGEEGVVDGGRPAFVLSGRLREQFSVSFHSDSPNLAPSSRRSRVETETSTSGRDRLELEQYLLRFFPTEIDSRVKTLKVGNKLVAGWLMETEFF